jgi:hypothetical protein
MSSDLATYANYASSFIQLVILAIGIYRALEMRRGFVDVTYRARALWSALFMSVIAIANAENFIPFPNNQLWNIVNFIPFLAIVGFAFAFVDKTVLVAIRSDFFHRDILRWSKLRVPVGSVLAGSTCFIFSGVVLTSQPATSSANSIVNLFSGIAFFQFSFVAAGVLGFGAVALVIGARRTSDRILRKHIRLLGFSVTSFVFLSWETS